MFRIMQGLISVLLLYCIVFSCGAFANELHFNYIVVGLKNAPDIPLLYDTNVAEFPSASPAMIESDIGGGTFAKIYEIGSGFRDRKLDLSSIPFWIYAKYKHKEGKLYCEYVLIDGYTPNKYENIKDVSKIYVKEDDDWAAVIRNCGSGFELVSRESYSSIFDIPFRSTYINGGENKFEDGVVASGLAHDYVNRLIKAFGGVAALQNWFNKTDSQKSRIQSFDDIPSLLKVALVEAGLHGSSGIIVTRPKTHEIN